MDNPGNLYGKVSPDNFPNENDYRNPIIAVAMKTLGYVNQFGRGIEAVQEELTERQKIILKYIEQNNTISAKEISALLQIVDRTVERDIQKLRKMGILERIGGDKRYYSN